MKVLVTNLNKFVKIAQKKLPFFVIVAFNAVEIRSNTTFFMDRHLSPSYPLKGTKTFHHVEIGSNKIHRNLLSPGCLCPSSSANENKDKSKFIKPECDCDKFYRGRYEFQREKGGSTIKVLPAMCEKNDLEEHFFLNANDKT